MNLQDRRSEFWVGLFTLAGVVLALYMVYKTGDLRWEKRGGYRVHVNFDNVSGLETGDTIRVAGVEVGRVERILLDRSLASLTLVIDSRVPLYEDATAEVKTYGMLGNQYVAIDPGHESLPRVPPDGEIRSTLAEDSLNVVMGKLSAVAGDVQSVTENLKKVFGGSEGEEALRGILANTRNLTEQIAAITSENREQIQGITTHLAQLTGDIQQMVSENREAVRQTLATLPETAENLRGITGDTRRLLDEHYDDLSSTLKQLRVASTRLDESLKNMEDVSKQIRQGEGTLGKLIYDKALYEEATNTMREARNLIEDLREQAPISALISLGGVFY